MFNPVTDRLKLVEKVVVSGRSLLGRIPLSLFDQDILVIEDVSQEIFRGKDYLGSVRPASFYAEKASGLNAMPSIKARRGDIIYCITLAPQPYDFTGTVQTQDSYQRIYEMQIVLVVNNPTRVIEWYHQSKDPAGWLKDHLKRNFELWAAGIGHDKLDSTRPSLDNTTQLLSNQCGIRITRYSWNFRIDPARSKELEIHKNTELRKIEMRSAYDLRMIEIENEHTMKAAEERRQREREREQKDFEREEKLKQNNFLREEKRRNQQNAAYSQLLSETVKDLVEMNRGQMRDAFDYNGSVKAVLQNSLRLLNVFDGPVPEEGKVIDTTSSDGTMPFEGEEDKTGLDNPPDSLLSSNEQ